MTASERGRGRHEGRGTLRRDFNLPKISPKSTVGTSLKNCPCISRLPSHQVLSSCTIHACVEAAQPCVYTPKTQPSHGVLQVRDCDSLWLTVADFLLTFPTSLSSSMPFSHINTFHAPCLKPDDADADCLCPHAHAHAHAPFA